MVCLFKAREEFASASCYDVLRLCGSGASRLRRCADFRHIMDHVSACPTGFPGGSSFGRSSDRIDLVNEPRRVTTEK